MNNTPRRLIGLTGGIGTGKTTVSKYLREKYHLPVLDADIYAREAVAEGSLILESIFARYGNTVRLANNNLDRSSLGKIIFNDAAEKQWLESQIHPYVRDRFNQELERTINDTIVLDIPLLFEANLTNMVTEIWVVSCDRSLQIARLRQRDSLTIEQVQARINSQIPVEEKIAAADVVLDNNTDLAHLYNLVDTALKSNMKA